MKTSLQCQIDAHQQNEVIALCTYENCNQKSRICCAFCILDNHKDHFNSIKKINELKDERTQSINNIQLLIHDLQIKINSWIDNLIKTIQDMQVQFPIQITQENLNKYAQQYTQIQSKLGSINIKTIEGVIENSIQSIEIGLTTQNENIDKKTQQAKEYNLQGNKLYESKQYLQAIELYDKAIALNPLSHFYWYNKGSTLHKLFKYQEALNAVETCLQLNEKYDLALTEKGYILNNMGNYNEAIVVLEASLAINPTNGLTWNEKGKNPTQFILGRALSYFNKLTESLECYEKSLEIKAFPVRYYNKGVILERLNRKEEAKECYKQSLEMDPNYENAKKALNQLK